MSDYQLNKFLTEDEQNLISEGYDFAFNTRNKLCIFKLKTNSISKLLGRVESNNIWGTFTVLGQLDMKDYTGGSPYFLVRFEDGTRVIAHAVNIRKGNIKNPNTPNVCGVGFIGQGRAVSHDKAKNKQTKEYNIWRGILKRCYNDSQGEYPTYKDCTVDPRWHNFQNFCEDIQYLENYDKWLEGTKEKRNPYDLDKDIKIEGNKVYSKETCMFVTRKENVQKASLGKEINLTGILYRGVNHETGEVFIFNNMRKFAREHDVSQQGISACVLGKIKRHKKIWTFEKINNKECQD